MGLSVVGKGLPVKGPLPNSTGLKTVPGGKEFVKAAVDAIQKKLPPKV